MKTCRKCHLEKPLTDYYAHRSTRDRLDTKCRACILEDQRIERLSYTPEQLKTRRVYFKAYYALHKDRILQQVKARQHKKEKIGGSDENLLQMQRA